MDRYLLTITIVSALLILLGALLLVKKFFSRFFKLYLVSFVIFLLGGGIYIYSKVKLGNQVSVNPAIGKHAYMTRSGVYLGVVEGSSHDSRRGQVWIVRPPGGYPVIYSKSRVTLKEKRE